MACCGSGGGIKFNGNESDDDDEFIGGNKLMYDRDIPGYDPRNLLYCKPLVDLAIDFYNEQHSTEYHVVDLIRIIGSICAGFYFYMKFTAKVDDADAITFGAQVFDGITETIVDYVDIVAEGAKLPVDTLPAWYIDSAGRRQVSVKISGESKSQE